MALNYTSFQSFPLQIVGITSDYNPKITAIENFVVAEIAYDGDASDLTAILPYFVFWFFCQDAASTVYAETGENEQVKEFSIPAMTKQFQAWNIGVDKLRVVCGITDETLEVYQSDIYEYTLKEAIEAILDANDISINTKYLSKRSVL